MKIRATAFYPPGSDFSRLETEQPESVIIESGELGFDLEHILAKFDKITDFEIHKNLTVDQGGDDEFYELTLPDVCDSESEAQTKCQMIYDYALELLQ